MNNWDKLKLQTSLPIMSILHYLLPQTWQRQPEPDSISDQLGQVEDYIQVLDTSLTIAYALSLDKIISLLKDEQEIRYIDLCCGPGLFSSLVSQAISVKDAVLVDLSKHMLDAASSNFQPRGVKVSFLLDDASALTSLEGRQFDLITFTNALHHLPSLDQVKKALERMDQLSAPNGFIVVVDPVRPKAEWLGRWYTSLLAADNLVKNRIYFQKDFEYSIAASWTADEMFSTLPAKSAKKWYLLESFGFPAFQFIIAGLRPMTKRELTQLTAAGENLVPHRFRNEYRLLNRLFRWGNLRTITDKN